MNTQWSVALGEGVGALRRDSTDAIFGHKGEMFFNFHGILTQTRHPGIYPSPPSSTNDNKRDELFIPSTFLSQVEWIRFYCKVFTELSDLVEEVL